MWLIYSKLFHTVSIVVYVSTQSDACMGLQVMGPVLFCVLSRAVVDVVPLCWNQPWVVLVSSLLHFNTIPGLLFGELNTCDLSICQTRHCFLLLLLSLIFNEHSQTWIYNKKICVGRAVAFACVTRCHLSVHSLAHPYSQAGQGPLIMGALPLSLTLTLRSVGTQGTNLPCVLVLRRGRRGRSWDAIR